MSETVTDEEVSQSRERVDELRNELVQTQKELAVSESSRSNAIQKAKLDNESDSLERQLQEARRKLQISEEENPEEVLEQATPARNEPPSGTTLNANTEKSTSTSPTDNPVDNTSSTRLTEEKK